MYEPREDSFLILKHVKEFVKPNSIVLDMGTGSGILAREASKYAGKVVAVDIDVKSLKQAKELSDKNLNIKFIRSDLFSNIEERGKFDLVMFNPPYLPRDEHDDGKDTCGGKHGHELITRFLRYARKYLKPNGKILLILSSLSGIKNLKRFFSDNGFKARLVEEKKIFFEKLFLYELRILL